MNLVALTEAIIKKIVSDPESVSIKEFDTEEENTIQIEVLISSDDMGKVIGKNGKTLESIQKYLKQSISAQTGMYVNIILDIENYKEKQNYFLERDVKKIARQVTLSKIDVKLDPMNSFQRRIVHNALSKFDYITTESVGVEPNRCVVIKYKEKSN